MYEATFHTTLRVSDPERQRRLSLAALIALSVTATVLASAATLERLGVERVTGPVQQFELLQFSLLPPPPIVEPPPPPKPIDGGEAGGAAMPAAIAPDPRESVDDARSDSLVQPQPPTNRIPDGIPGNNGILSGLGCPPGGCTGPLHPGPIGPGTCTGPNCKPGPKPVERPPAEVEFSALRCLACADPDAAALRKTVASMQKRDGSVTVKFCVDLTGHVDKSSIKVSRSFGVPTVDQITTAAIKRWRFAPMVVDGKARRTCSRAVFNIRFD